MFEGRNEREREREREREIDCQRVPERVKLPESTREKRVPERKEEKIAKYEKIKIYVLYENMQKSCNIANPKISMGFFEDSPEVFK